MKQMFKKLMSLTVVIACTATFMVGCTDDNKEVSTQNGEKLSVSVAARVMGTGYSDMDKDALYKEYSDKFGIELDIAELPSETSDEKVRLLIASADVPDVMSSGFNYAEYLSYANQGLIGALPDDYEEKYPSLAWAIKNTGLKDSLEKTDDGKIYTIPRTLSIFSQETEGTKEVNIDSYGILYRKDWADKLGIEIPMIVEYDEFIEIAKKMQNADFHNGKEIIGVSLSYDEAPNLFVTACNSSYQMFHKSNGKYVYGLTEDTTLEGVKMYAQAYRDGILHPNFYSHKSADATNRFFAGEAAMYFGNTCGAATFHSNKNKFQQANPDLDAEEALGIFWIKSPDGKVHGRENNNYWMTWYFGPQLEGEKQHRVLSMFDYIKSKDGFKEFRLGAEGIDYKKNNGEYELLTWNAQDNGSYTTTNSYNFASLLNLMSAEEHADAPFIIYSDDTREKTSALRKAKLAEKTDLYIIDYDVRFFTGERYRNFMSQIDVNTMMAEVVVSKGDIEKEWNKKLDGIKGMLEPALKELNENLLEDK